MTGDPDIVNMLGTDSPTDVTVPVVGVVHDVPPDPFDVRT